MKNVSDDNNFKSEENLTISSEKIHENFEVNGNDEEISSTTIEPKLEILSKLNNDHLMINESSDDSKLKRVKKSNSLTTICVEIKPTSPYEPPYFMCKGTEPQNGYKSQQQQQPSYGGSNSYRPSSGQGGDYTAPQNYRPLPSPPNQGSNSYRPSSGQGGDYTAPQNYRPLPSPPNQSGGGGGGGYEAQHYPNSGYAKPNPTAIKGGYSSGGYSKPEDYNSYNQPPSSSAGYVRPTADSYNQLPLPASHARPTNYGLQNYDSYGPPSEYNRPGGYVAPTKYGAPPSAYGSPSAPSGPAYGVPSNSYGSSNKNKPMTTGYNKPSSEGKYQPSKFSTSGNKKASSYSSGGYRTYVDDDDDDDDDDEMEIDDDMETGDQQNVGMPLNYAPPPKSYNYPSMSQVPCSTNLLFGCQPNVIPVPCFAASAAPAPILYGYPAAPAAVSPSSQPIPSPIMYGPPPESPESLPKQPVLYYPNILSMPREMMTPSVMNPGLSWSDNQAIDKTKSDKETTSGDSETKLRTQDDDRDDDDDDDDGMSIENRNDMKFPDTADDNGSQEDKSNDDKMRKVTSEQSNKTQQDQQKSPMSPSYTQSQFFNHQELIRKALEGKSMKGENEKKFDKSGSGKDEGLSKDRISSLSTGKDVELLKRGDDDDDSSNNDDNDDNKSKSDKKKNHKIDTMMKMQQMQERMAQIMAAQNNGNMHQMMNGRNNPGDMRTW